MTAIIIRGDARRLPLPDASVDLVCTSPPYFALRSYQDGGEHFPGQLGSETTPAAFVDALIDCTREMVRVLKPSGSIFVDLGDKYSGAGRGNNQGERLTNPAEVRAARYETLNRRQHVGKGIIPAKSLMGIPWRYAIRCVDDLGLILRAEIIWDKPNGLPESVTDRVRRSHEVWFHLVKQPRYYSAIDEVREAQVGGDPNRRAGSKPATVGDKSVRRLGFQNDTPNPLGKLPGSVWSIPSQPLTVPAHLGVDHFAAFPCEWPRRIILGWTPGGICVECGEGRRPTTSEGEARRNRPLTTKIALGPPEQQMSERSRLGWTVPRTITGHACACTPVRRWEEETDDVDEETGEPLTIPRHEYDLTNWDPAPTRPAVILDPFGGTGTTSLVASALGRIGISVDLSHDYSRLAQWRTTDPAERAKALHVDKPPPVLDGQLDMWEGALT